MNKADRSKLKIGLYRVYWKDGSYSFAAVGMMDSGDRWLAPVNWVYPSDGRSAWKRVDFVKRIIAT